MFSGGLAMQRFSFLLIASLLTIYLGANCPTINAGQASIDAQEYAIYNHLINGKFANRGFKSVIVLDTTLDLHADRMMQSHLSYIQQNVRDVSRKIIAEFEKKNQQAYSLSNQFDASGNIALLSRDQVREMFGKGGIDWRAIYEKYPRPAGIISFSRVSFNSRRDEALVYVTWSCGGECGQRGFLLLKKKKNGWVGQAVGVQVVS
jgi:5'-3' exonuclease